MHILLSNDDGILAAGLSALRWAVADMGKITVVTPDCPQSAMGHSITLRAPLTVQPVRVGSGESAFPGLSVDGRPADCVRLAVRSLLDGPADLVLSGINAGANVGINVFYSGTVAAAAEAAMLGLPAVAFSADISGGEVDFDRVAKLCRGVLDELLKDGLSGGQVVNVNIPSLGSDRPKGVKVARQSTAGLEDLYHRTDGAGGKTLYQLGGSYRFAQDDENSDAICLADGYITITPLKVDMTDHARLSRMAGETWKAPPIQ